MWLSCGEAIKSSEAEVVMRDEPRQTSNLRVATLERHCKVQTRTMGFQNHQGNVACVQRLRQRHRLSVEN